MQSATRTMSESSSCGLKIVPADHQCRGCIFFRFPPLPACNFVTTSLQLRCIASFISQFTAAVIGGPFDGTVLVPEEIIDVYAEWSCKHPCPRNRTISRFSARFRG